jgi:hypothetical protein
LSVRAWNFSKGNGSNVVGSSNTVATSGAWQKGHAEAWSAAAVVTRNIVENGETLVCRCPKAWSHKGKKARNAAVQAVRSARSCSNITPHATWAATCITTDAGASRSGANIAKVRGPVNEWFLDDVRHRIQKLRKYRLNPTHMDKIHEQEDGERQLLIHLLPIISIY